MDTPFELWNTRRIPTFNMGTERREAWNAAMSHAAKMVELSAFGIGAHDHVSLVEAILEAKVRYIRYDLRNTRIHPAGYWRTD